MDTTAPRSREQRDTGATNFRTACPEVHPTIAADRPLASRRQQRGGLQLHSSTQLAGSETLITDSSLRAKLLTFLRGERGQDMVEYALLLAFVALASAALFIGAGGSVQGIWSGANTVVTEANSAADQ